MSNIGAMAMPADFRYKEVFLRGQPQHDRFDLFRLRHPCMDVRRRAKIFSPFDALKGFNEAVSSRNVQYCGRVELNDEDQKELDRRLGILKGLTYNGRMARNNRVNISAVYYEPCSDEANDAYCVLGQYRKLSGICWNVDEINRNILIDRVRISFDDILRIESADGVFQKDWSSGYPEE